MTFRRDRGFAGALALAVVILIGPVLADCAEPQRLADEINAFLMP